MKINYRKLLKHKSDSNFGKELNTFVLIYFHCFYLGVLSTFENVHIFNVIKLPISIWRGKFLI